jgi:hypothetical protein
VGAYELDVPYELWVPVEPDVPDVLVEYPSGRVGGV